MGLAAIRKSGEGRRVGQGKKPQELALPRRAGLKASATGKNAEKGGEIGSSFASVDWLPRSLHYVAGSPLRLRSGQANCGAEEKTGHSDRDDRGRWCDTGRNGSSAHFWNITR